MTEKLLTGTQSSEINKNSSEPKAHKISLKKKIEYASYLPYTWPDPEEGERGLPPLKITKGY